MFRFEDSLAVPAYDTLCLEAGMRERNDLGKVLQHVQGSEVAVQAGGNFGLWAQILSERFKAVYTFEPDDLNFPCLAWNTREKRNVFRFQAALSDERQWVGMKTFHDQHNAGMQYVDGPGFIPAVRLDDFCFPACDLIYLDIEGYEPQALIGARNLIARFKPVIAFEDKGLSNRDKRHRALEMLKRMGYEHIETVNNDKVYVC